MTPLTPPRKSFPFTALPVLLALLLIASAMLPAHAGDSAGPPTAQPNSTGTVTVSRVDTHFIQSGGSCVLASYFTGEPVSAYFEGYCRHFGIAYHDAPDAERQYADHFDREWKKRNCMGYEVILDLHSNSTEKCFVNARRLFDAKFYRESAKHLDELEHTLRTRESLLNITYHVSGDTHSVTVLRDGASLLLRDTNQKGLHPIPNLAKIGNLADCVMYIRK
jgi:hypothetical protein